MATDSALDAGGPRLAAAERVLFLPELFEKILDHVQLCDLFRAALVCRTWNAIFEKSRPLQVKAQLKEDGSGDWFEDEFDDELGLFVTSQSDLSEDGNLYFGLGFVMDEHGPIRLTGNLRKCLATQPGCKEMEVERWCCRDDIEYISNEAGITIGDVVDAARRVCAEHENCPQMVEQSREHRFDSTRYTTFRGQVQLAEGHPQRVEAKVKRAVTQAEDLKRVEKHTQAGCGDIWYAFRKARRTAAASGEDLPRWPEFLALNSELAPKDYQLNEAEASASSISRQLEPSEED